MCFLLLQFLHWKCNCKQLPTVIQDKIKSSSKQDCDSLIRLKSLKRVHIRNPWVLIWGFILKFSLLSIERCLQVFSINPSWNFWSDYSWNFPRNYFSKDSQGISPGPSSKMKMNSMLSAFSALILLFGKEFHNLFFQKHQKGFPHVFCH